MIDISAATRYIPKTQTVNQDRLYYTVDNFFIKEDTVIERGLHEAKILKFLTKNHFTYSPKYIENQVDIDKKVHRLVMEKVSGETIENLVLFDTDKQNIASELFCMFGRLIDLKVCHGDINESNVLYDATTKQVKLIDFEKASYAKSIADHSNDLSGPPWGIMHLLRTRLV